MVRHLPDVPLRARRRKLPLVIANCVDVLASGDHCLDVQLARCRGCHALSPFRRDLARVSASEWSFFGLLLPQLLVRSDASLGRLRLLLQLTFVFAF